MAKIHSTLFKKVILPNSTVVTGILTDVYSYLAYLLPVRGMLTSILLLRFGKKRSPKKSSRNAIFDTISPKISLQVSILCHFIVFCCKKATEGISDSVYRRQDFCELGKDQEQQHHKHLSQDGTFISGPTRACDNSVFQRLLS